MADGGAAAVGRLCAGSEPGLGCGGFGWPVPAVSWAGVHSSSGEDAGVNRLAGSEPATWHAWNSASPHDPELITGITDTSKPDTGPQTMLKLFTLHHPGPRQSPLSAFHDRLQRTAWPTGMVAQGCGDAGVAGQPQDGDG